MMIFNEKKIKPDSHERKVYDALKTIEKVKATKLINLSTIVKLAKEARSLYESYLKAIINGKNPGTTNPYYAKMNKAYINLKNAVNNYQLSYTEVFRLLQPLSYYEEDGRTPFADHLNSFEATGNYSKAEASEIAETSK